MTPDPVLYDRARQALAAASVIAEARSSNPEPTTGGGKPESKEPIGTGASLFDTIAAAFIAATSDDEFRRAVYHAEAAIDRARRSPRHHRELAHDRDKRIVADYAGLPAEEAAAWEGVTAENIRRTRRDHGRNPSTGGPRRDAKRVAWSTRTDRAVKARLMLEHGESLRTAADALGVSHVTVIRDLRWLDQNTAA